MMNLDEDHLQDLPCLLKFANVKSAFSNPTVTATALRSMKKKHGMGFGVEKAHDLLQYFGTSRLGDCTHDLGGVRWQAFWNPYGAAPFDDTNNLSLAVFVSFGPFTILFGGDMEKAGWERLLLNPWFVARLRDVNVYVASHHGRENGICDGLFEHMSPQLIVFSDGTEEFETQETTGWYARRSSGAKVTMKPSSGMGVRQRKVMTTRRDGTISIDVANDGWWTVTPEHGVPTLEEIVAEALARPTKNADNEQIARALAGLPQPSDRQIAGFGSGGRTGLLSEYLR
jgi:beta-lactamase superfamily II metal-dependent hydrolase